MNAFRRLPSLALAALLPLALSATGCGDDPGDGSVVVDYGFGLGTSCDDPFGTGDQTVTQVRVTLTNGSTVFEKSALCGPDDITIDGVKQGNYDVLIEGLDDDGDTIADNINIPSDDDESVSVSEGSTANVNADINPTPALIEVALVINDTDGFALMCDSAPLKFFEVTAVGIGQPSQHTAELDYCTHGSGFQPVPDEMRMVNGLLMNRVDIDAQDSNMNSIAEMQFPLGGVIGAGKTVRINVTCTETDCDGALSFPEGNAPADGGGDTGDGGETGGDDDGGESSSGSGDGADSGSGG